MSSYPSIFSMLYPTHHHYPFTQSPHLLQEMECVQETLTNGFWPENKTASLDDDFFVDELLDFSNGFSETEEQLPPPPSQPEENDQTFSVSPDKFTTEPEKNDDFGSLPETELTLQAEEGLESLEWLSNFVEESFSVYPLTGKLPPNATDNRSKSAVTVQEQFYFATPVQTKARTKRGRTGVRVWPVVSPSFNNESSTSSSSSTSSTTTSFSPNNIWHVQSQTLVPFPAKRPYKKKKNVEDGEGSVTAQPRRCTHCGVTKTPQWRAGPHGSKSLCNACGVRYKSGRLLPEYRPACSPTFSSELHSNNHRKVLEMRRQKDAEVDPAGLVQSF